MLGLDPLSSLCLFSDWLSVLQGKAAKCTVPSSNSSQGAGCCHPGVLVLVGIPLVYSKHLFKLPFIMHLLCTGQGSVSMSLKKWSHFVWVLDLVGDLFVSHINV